MDQHDANQANQQNTQSHTKPQKQDKNLVVMPVLHNLWATRSALHAIEQWDLGLESEGTKKYEPKKVYCEGKGELSYPDKKDLILYPSVIRFGGKSSS